MVLVDVSSFILFLEKLALGARNGSSFTVTFKRFDGYEKPVPRCARPLLQPVEYLCLVRAQMKSRKISTIVKREDVPRVMSMYAQFMKSNIDGLKRVKKIKSKAKVAKG